MRTIYISISHYNNFVISQFIKVKSLSIPVPIAVIIAPISLDAKTDEILGCQVFNIFPSMEEWLDKFYSSLFSRTSALSPSTRNSSAFSASFS